MHDFMSANAFPQTTQGQYLGAIAALNIPSGRGTGEWQMTSMLFGPHPSDKLGEYICGDGNKLNTNPLLGDAGVFDCADKLKELGVILDDGCVVYAANHARAVADLVLSAAQSGSDGATIARRYQLAEWMPKDEDKQEVFELLAQAAHKMLPEHAHAVAQWVELQRKV